MKFQLLFTKGPDEGRSVPLRAGQKLLLGRGEECQLVIHDPHVSRAHCRIEVYPDEVLLIDAGSTYGTQVNGGQVERHRLTPGDRIALGESEIHFGLRSDPAGETVSPGSKPLVAAKPADRAKPPVRSDLDALIGQTIERYHVTDFLARGTTGYVFRADDKKYNRPVAFKVLYPELAQDETEVNRFIRAMKTMLPIKHENVVCLYGAGHSQGRCWMAMELVEGENLAAVIDRLGVGGMLDWQYALRVALDVARALEAAYEHKIVHRNISPSNILIRQSDRKAKLGDLMLAKALEGTKAEVVTRTGELVGQLAYMSPEQAAGARDIDCRSDIYNLGATVYRLVAGRTPFVENNAADLIRKIRSEDPPTPTKFQLSVAPLFEGAILKMLARNRDERFQNPAALIRDLERVAEYQGLDS